MRGFDNLAHRRHAMKTETQANKFPELVFGVAGPIGVSVEAICDSLRNSLHDVGYTAHEIHLTKKMRDYSLLTEKVAEPVEQNFFTDVSFKIDYANALCKEAKDSATLARIALRSIWQKREELTKGQPAENSEGSKLPLEATAYIIRQLKRPEEVHLLRKVYGRQFVLVSAYGSVNQRRELLEERIRRTASTTLPGHKIEAMAAELLERDANEERHDFGQQLRETFHLADVFIDGLSKQEMDAKLDRFVQAFFGRTDIAPSKEEYGMYAAKSASLRSSDLSRQIGAAIFTDDGELITQGCNEVPKAFGGTYWDLEQPDYRDVRRGFDPNDILKKELLRDVVDRLAASGLLSEKAKSMGAPGEMVDELIRKHIPGSDEQDGPLARSLVMDVTEFGRVVHAEMCAICDAARLGKSVKGATLFCTTFPCHNCTKHVLAAGIKRVVYMEPYPKSRAKDLHENEIEIENDDPQRVSFVPFLGISPYRYRDIFQKSRRKSSDGKAKRWMAPDNEPRPMVEFPSVAYFDLEADEFSTLLGTKK